MLNRERLHVNLAWSFRGSLLTLVLAAAAHAQTAQLTGTVADPSGALVAGAKVTATNVDTGVARASITNEAGNYLITALLPGKYRVSSEAPGFKMMQRDSI